MDNSMTLKLNDSSLIKSQAYINGQWVDADSGETLAVTNPATGEVLTQVAKCGTAETRRMIEGSRNSAKGLGQDHSQRARHSVAQLV
jgi:succinate-semialdehyde dehydrogenase/glutarate-semialdehyde dehydrogenase